MPAPKPTPTPGQTFIISSSAGPGGIILLAGDIFVESGSSQTFAITPNRGYVVKDVRVDGVSIGAVNSYTFTNISASHTIEASFARAQ